jgi:hypothetical protein
VLDGVGMVQASFFEELLEVVYGWSCLALAAADGLYGTLYTRAACSLIDVVIVVGCDLLVVLFTPLLAGVGHSSAP